MNIDWQAIDLVMFDMDGTLLDLAFDNLFWQQAVPQAWAALHQYPFEQAVELLKPQFQAQEGTLNWYSLPYWSRALNLDLTTLKIQYQDHICLRPHALQLLHDLKMANKKLWLVTNAHPIVLNVKLQKTGMGHWFDQLISSHELGFAKEQELFWHKLAAKHPFDKQRTIFIDDSEPVLHAAQHYGIAHVYGIVQPDSKKPARQQLKFPAIDQLNELSSSLLSIQVEQ